MTPDDINEIRERWKEGMSVPYYATTRGQEMADISALLSAISEREAEIGGLRKLCGEASTKIERMSGDEELCCEQTYNRAIGFPHDAECIVTRLRDAANADGGKQG